MNNKRNISIIGGAGHVGFPLCLIFGSNGFKVNLIETLLVVASTFISYYLLSIDYSYFSYFIIMLIASSLTLVFSIYIYYHFHKEKLN